MQTNDAVNSVRGLAAQFAGLAKVIEVLDRVGSIEQAADQEQSRLEIAKAALATTTAALEAARKDLDAASNEAQQARAKAKASAEQVLLDAQNAAASTVLEAHHKAASLVDGALARQAALAAEVEQAQAAFETVNAERTKILADLEGKIAAARAAVAAINGESAP